MFIFFYILSISLAAGGRTPHPKIGDMSPKKLGGPLRKCFIKNSDKPHLIYNIEKNNIVCKFFLGWTI